MNISIQELIDSALVRDDKYKGSGKIKPSGLGYCYRRQYWDRAGEPVTNPPDKRALRIFKAGSLFHDFVQSLLTDIQNEVLIETDDIKGYADLVNENEVIDLKSQHSRAFWWMSKTSSIEEEKKKDWMQVMFYAIALGKPRARLVYISKDDLCIQEYSIEVNDKWRKLVEDELKTLRGYWERKELPAAVPRCYPQKDGSFKECSYCPFLDRCKKEEQ